MTLRCFIDFSFKQIMKHIRKALIDTIVTGGMIMIFAVFQESTVLIYRALIPITAIACYNFIKAAFGIYIDKKCMHLN